MSETTNGNDKDKVFEVDTAVGKVRTKGYRMADVVILVQLAILLAFCVAYGIYCTFRH